MWSSSRVSSSSSSSWVSLSSPSSGTKKGNPPHPSLSDLKPNLGDIIEFERGIYRHVGIYIGDGKIVHKVNLGNGKGKIEEARLEDVADGDPCRIDNQTSTANSLGLKARSVNTIVNCAKANVGIVEQFDAESVNCEEWATRMRYGEGFSMQGATLQVVKQASGPFGVVSSGIFGVSASLPSSSK